MFQLLADVILLSARVPVQPNVKEVGCNRAVDGVPPKVKVTFVSSTFVKAEGVTVGIVGNVANDPSPLKY